MLSLIFAGALAMSADLAGGTWHPSTIRAHDVSAEKRVFISFDKDGKASGNGGCNRFFGSYTIEGNAISIGPIISTKMGCPGKYELETSFFAMLQAAKTFSQDGSSLVLFDAAGRKIAEFVRTDDA